MLPYQRLRPAWCQAIERGIPQSFLRNFPPAHRSVDASADRRPPIVVCLPFVAPAQRSEPRGQCGGRLSPQSLAEVANWQLEELRRPVRGSRALPSIQGPLRQQLAGVESEERWPRPSPRRSEASPNQWLSSRRRSLWVREARRGARPRPAAAVVCRPRRQHRGRTRRRRA